MGPKTVNGAILLFYGCRNKLPQTLWLQITHLSSYSSRGWKSKKQCHWATIKVSAELHSSVRSEKESIFILFCFVFFVLLLPASKGCLHSLAHGPTSLGPLLLSHLL